MHQILDTSLPPSLQAPSFLPLSLLPLPQSDVFSPLSIYFILPCISFFLSSFSLLLARVQWSLLTNAAARELSLQLKWKVSSS
jgi:hypothetical protein